MPNFDNFEKIIPNIKKIIPKSPIAKTVSFVVTVIIAGILVAGFTNENCENNQVKWKRIPQSPSLLGLIVLTVCIYCGHKFFEETSVTLTKQERIIIYIIRASLPELAARAKNAANRGDYEELIKIKDLISTLLQREK